MAAKAKKQTAKDQGFPAVWLDTKSGNFKPGHDAKAKSCLVTTVVTGKAPKGAPRGLTVEQATKLLKARGWMKFVDAKRASIAKKAAAIEAKSKDIDEQVARVEAKASGRRARSHSPVLRAEAIA